MTKNRPYFNKSIADLEKLHKDDCSDDTVLQQLLHELEFRTTARYKPNLVNVAVTRAKSSLFVIGNRELWKSTGVFAVLDRLLPTDRIE